MLTCFVFEYLFTFKPLFIFHEFLYIFLIILIKLKKTIWGSTPQSSSPGEGYFQVLIKNNINFALKLINHPQNLLSDVFLSFCTKLRPQKYFT